MTLDSCWEYFWSIIRGLDPMGHQNEPQGLPGTDLHYPRSPKGAHFGYQKSFKIDKITPLEATRFLNRFFHENWMTSALKKHDFSSRIPTVRSFSSSSYKSLFFDRKMSENLLRIPPKTIQNPSRKRSWTLSKN